MLTINIKKDNFAYLDDNMNARLFILLQKSFTRKKKVYNNFFKTYENQIKRFYSVVTGNRSNLIKIKAGLVPFLCKSLDDNTNIEYKIIDERRKINKEKINIISRLNEEVILRPYQLHAVQEVFNNSFGCIQLPTGAGKTEVAASMIKTYMSAYKNEAILYVVPTITLQTEASDRFKKYNIPVNTEYPLKNNTVNIVTYLSLIRANTEKLDYKQRDLISFIIWDEAHHLNADKSSKIIHKYHNLRMSIGMSATPSESVEDKKYLKDLDAEDFNIYGCTGKVIYKLDIEETIENSFVTPIEVHVVPFNSHIIIDDEVNYDWHLLKSVLLKSEERAEFTAKYTKHVFNKYNLHTLLLLIPEVQWSMQYMSKIAEEFIDSKDVKIYELHGQNRMFTYISGKIVELKSEEDKQIAYNNIRSSDVKTVFSATSFIFEGVNITSIQAIINCYGGKSTKRIKQQCGRAMRLFENKEIAYIHEIKDNDSRVLLSQFNKRIDVYRKEYNAKIIQSKFKLDK